MLRKDLHFPISAWIQNAISGQILGNVLFCFCHHRFVGYSPVLSRSSFWSCGQLSYQVTRLREYQGVDPHFDTIARQYHDIVKVTPVCILPLLSKILSLISCQPRPAEIGKHAMDNPSSWNGPETVTRSSKSLNWIYFLTF
jgi:hypothetical protein